MPGQVIGTVNVQVNTQKTSAVRSITYGARTLKSATDLSITGAEDGDVVVYEADTNSFKLAPVSGAAASFDAGEF
jgi:hypothetical protein